ncbi:lysozyme family protein [Vibrio parahaemolyticus]|uniref:hypothetical protein n=1 Tax=Vibrio parahaemolyticus TaxID=670 RepID=UPI000812F8A2|nr:hypothetical protein [Vibrio parahaemolyticus]OCP68303.1 hypothetical protein AKH08_15925 [Vibrio parahaemolyticus]
MNRLRYFVLSLSVLCLVAKQADASQVAQIERNRDLILNTHLKKYRELGDCMIEASTLFSVPEWMIYAIVYHERGPVHGALVNKSNGTRDWGPTGINDVRLIDYSDMGVRITGPQISKNPCIGIRMTGHLLRKEYDKLGTSEKSWLTAAGNYHYNKKGTYPHNHYKYIGHIKDSLRRFQKTIEEK